MKLQSKRITAMIAFMLVAIIANAEILLLNNRQFEKIDGQWYQIDRSFKYLVDYTVITVKYKDSVTDAEKNAKNQALGCSVIRVNTLGYYDLRIPEGSDPLQIVQDYMSSELVKIAEPNAIGVFNSESNDPLYSEQWHNHDEILEWGIDSYKAWDRETGDPNIKIAVIDSGSDIFHEDLKGNIWVNPGEDLDGDGIVWDVDDINGVDDDGNGFIDDFVGWDFYNNSNNATGTNYHGTHVAGITGALSNNSKGVAGVAGGWSVENQGCSMLIASLGSYGEGSVLDDAILYAAMNGARIITLSLGLPPSYAIEDAIETAYNNYGVFINCASGNDGKPSLSFPASNRYVVAVGASDKNGLKTSFSNYGEGLKVVAPGVDIWSTRIGNVYNTGNGTSYSSPQVAGTAGLIASRFPSFSNKDIEKVICLTAMKLPYSFDQMKEYGTWNNFVGYGKLNTDRALGLTGVIDKSQKLVEGNYICGQDVIVTNNAALTCYANSRTYLFDQTNLTIQVGSSLVLNTSSNLIAEGNSRIIGNLQIADGAHIEVLDNSTLSFQLSQLSITAGTTVKLGKNAKLIIENGSNFTIADGTVVELGDNAEIVVMNKGYLTATGTTFSYSSFTGKWLGINCLGGSTVNLNNSTLSKAETGVSGLPFRCVIQNSTFDQCGSGIAVEGCDSLLVKNNTLTGTGSGIGSGISITQKDGWLIGNTISGFRNGITAISSTPNIFDNTISGNRHSGLYVAGLNALPVLIKPVSHNVLAYYLNNKIFDNGYVPDHPVPTITTPGQICVLHHSNIMMKYGHNNVYSDLVSAVPEVPCLVAATLFPEGELPRIQILNAEGTYWGAGTVISNFFRNGEGYSIDYDPWHTWPWGQIPSTSSYPEPDSKSYDLLLKALNNEYEGKYDKAISEYEKIIKKYPDSEEVAVAYAKLPGNYSELNLGLDPLISLYDTQLSSADENVNKKFFKEMKVTTHLKAKNYDAAIALSEEMKLEADSDEEKVLCDIDIAIANLLKESGKDSKGNVDQRENLKRLYAKLEDAKNEPTGITEESLPQTVKLYQNYPNPFNPVTQIKFDLTKTSDAKLRVYNVSGQLVAELADGVMNVGSHTVDFDGSRLNSGVYYYTLEVNGKSYTQKMILMK